MQDVASVNRDARHLAPCLRTDRRTRLAGVLKAFADPACRRLFSLIQSAPHSEASVSDLTGPLGLSESTISHHLRILIEAGLLERGKRGVWGTTTSYRSPSPRSPGC